MLILKTTKSKLPPLLAVGKSGVVYLHPTTEIIKTKLDSKIRRAESMGYTFTSIGLCIREIFPDFLCLDCKTFPEYLTRLCLKVK